MFFVYEIFNFFPWANGKNCLGFYNLPNITGRFQSHKKKRLGETQKPRQLKFTIFFKPKIVIWGKRGTPKDFFRFFFFLTLFFFCPGPF